MRRPLDAYYTPPWMVQALLDHEIIEGVVLEPCAGDGGIAQVLRRRQQVVWTNDIDRGVVANSYLDAATPLLWQHDASPWVVTNPPYAMPTCIEIVRQAVDAARVGVAMLLRLSFLEPTRLRGPWLKEHPPTRLLVMPRYSFSQDGKSDSVTVAWMIWRRSGLLPGEPAIVVCEGADNKEVV